MIVARAGHIVDKLEADAAAQRAKMRDLDG